ncbi:MAG: vitamin B12-dependent ribonucleotide reductase [Nitrospirae bacterium]|nr:vitamin B12-dependent ribonucleotide reductase [Nitrospirota bacterium]
MKKETNDIALSPNSLKVLERRYLKKNSQGEVTETPQGLFRRVAKTIAMADLKFGKEFAEVEKLETDFYEMMTQLNFLPNSPTLMNAGRELGQLSACFVIPIQDSMESIFDGVKNAAIIHKSGGGTGFSFSNLRPNGDMVGSTKGVSSGPISFMTVFDSATEAVKQGGTRRGANMAILRVDHPDILDFITCKDNLDKLNNFNISVALTSDFMNAVEKNEQYDIINPRTKQAEKTIEARYVLDVIIKHAWQTGEPGVIFIDRINESNPTPKVGMIESTNPCGEQPLLAFESCNLGSINLSKMVKDGHVDYEKLKDITHKAVHFLDNVIDINKYPLKQIKEITQANRKIGLGIMGWADMLIDLGIPYNSEKALTLAEELMKFIRQEGRNQSTILAEQRGVFPNHDKSIYHGKMKLRNATITTIAPTGSLSIIAGCSSGIEPLFAVSYIRTVLEGTKMIEVNPKFEEIARKKGFHSDELMTRISESASIKDFKDIPADIRKIFVTSHDISPSDHIKTQAAFQTHTCNAVSKTVNFPTTATPEDVKEVYLLAYKTGCKGVTVYRDGSRDEQVLSVKKKSTASKPAAVDSQVKKDEYQKIVPKKRPDVIKGTTHCIKTGCGNLYVTINANENNSPFEIFNHIGKAGGCAASQSEAIGRLLSLALRCDIAVDQVIKQLKGISCHQPSWASVGKISSCADAVAKALELHQKHFKIEHTKDGEVFKMGACPECGGTVEHEGGCAVCHDCGFTKCG